MSDYPPAVRGGSIVWSLVLGGLIVFIGGGILLPSTKRAHFDYRERLAQEAASTAPATAPTDVATTQP